MNRIRPARSFAAACAVLVLGACGASVLERPANWTAADEVPELESRPLAPKPPAGDEWDEGGGGLTFRAKSDVPPGEPYASDDAAVAAAKAWVVERFAVAAEGLEVTAVDHSASGSPEPMDAADRGHTIVLHQTYRGIRADGCAIVYMRGKTIESVSCYLHAYRPVPGTSHACVSSTAAAAAWHDLFAQRGVDAAALARYDAELQPRLQFAWTHRPGTEVDRVVPTWVIREHEPYMVDAHTGKAWVND